MSDQASDGSRRLVISYLSIGEAEDYRPDYFTKEYLEEEAPDWLMHENKNWKGNRGKAGFMVEERAYLDRWFGRERPFVKLVWSWLRAVLGWMINVGYGGVKAGSFFAK